MKLCVSQATLLNLQIKYNIEEVGKISVLSRASLFAEVKGNRLAGKELES